MTFTGNYPASITAGKVVVIATAESSDWGVANAVVNSASTTQISVSVYTWKSNDVATTGNRNTNGIYLTLMLGQ